MEEEGIAALLTLSGQLLEHKASVQNIKTTALLERDAMDFKRAQLDKERKLEYDKSVFQIQMNDIKIMEKELETVNAAITERTGVIPDNPTSGFTDFHQKSGKKNKELGDVIGSQAKQQTSLYSNIRKGKQELLDINNALQFIDKHVKWEGGDDPEQWDIGDYQDAIAEYKVKANVNDLSSNQQLALDKGLPGPKELQDLNLALAEKNAKQTQQKLDAARLGHEEHNLEQTKALMDIQSDRETLTLFPEVAALTEDAKTANDYISSIMSDDDFVNDSVQMMADGYDAIGLTNPLFDLVGAEVYLEAYGAATGANPAPEYFINRVIAPAVGVVQAYTQFLTSYPPATSRTFSSDEAKAKYTKDRQKRLDGFFVQLSESLGIETKDENGELNRDAIINRAKIEAVAKKLKNLLGTQAYSDVRLIKYAKLIEGNVNRAQELGLAGENLEILLDPNTQDMLELIRTINNGSYNGSKNDESSVVDKFNTNIALVEDADDKDDKTRIAAMFNAARMRRGW